MVSNTAYEVIWRGGTAGVVVAVTPEDAIRMFCYDTGAYQEHCVARPLACDTVRVVCARDYE